MLTKKQAALRAQHELWDIKGLNKEADPKVEEAAFSDDEHDNTPCYKVSIPLIFGNGACVAVCIEKEIGGTLGMPFPISSQPS